MTKFIKKSCHQCFSQKQYCEKCSFLNCMYEELENGDVYRLFRDYFKNGNKK